MRRRFSDVAASAGKKDSRASSDKVMSTGVPNIVVVLINARTPCFRDELEGHYHPGVFTIGGSRGRPGPARGRVVGEFAQEFYKDRGGGDVDLASQTSK